MKTQDIIEQITVEEYNSGTRRVEASEMYVVQHVEHWNPVAAYDKDCECFVTEEEASQNPREYSYLRDVMIEKGYWNA